MLNGAKESIYDAYFDKGFSDSCVTSHDFISPKELSLLTVVTQERNCCVNKVRGLVTGVFAAP